MSEKFETLVPTGISGDYGDPTPYELKLRNTAERKLAINAHIIELADKVASGQADPSEEEKLMQHHMAEVSQGWN